MIKGKTENHLLKCFGQWSERCSGKDHCCCETQCKKESEIKKVKDKYD